jgi:hypothetical protein
MTGKKGSSGGPRKGAGRPQKKKVVSEKVRKNFQKAAEELAEEYGESIEKAGLRLVFKKGVQDSVKVAALKEYGQILASKDSNKLTTVEDNAPDFPRRPTTLSDEEMDAYRLLKPRWDELSKAFIILPKRRPDPAKQIQSNNEPKKNKVIKLDENK